MINHSYRNMTQSELDGFGALVISRLTTNPIFSSLKEAVTTGLVPAHTAFSAAKQDASSKGGSDRMQLRETTRAKLIDQLYLTSVSVEAIAKGNASIIDASGFPLRKVNKSKSSKKEPILVGTPQSFKVENVVNKPGMLYLSWTEVVGAINYTVEEKVFGEAEAIWGNAQNTTKNFLEVSGYAHNAIIEFRVRTIGDETDRSDWSLIFKIIVN